MFASGFEYELPSGRARCRQDELRSDDLMILRMAQTGGIVDESLDRPRAGRATEWSRIRVVLDGPIHFRAGSGVEIGRGEIFGSSAVPGRSLARSSDWVDLVWRNGSAIGERLPESVVLRLSPSAFERIGVLATALRRRDLPAVLGAARAVLADLRAEGLPFEPDALSEAAATAAAAADRAAPEFARVLEPLITDLASQPMAVDLSRALAVCERQAMRRASQHFQRFHLSASSWREFMSCLRLEMGALFMSAEGARTEEVSRYLGFASPTSFCHAMKDAGLPSPQALQAELRCA